MKRFLKGKQLKVRLKALQTVQPGAAFFTAKLKRTLTLWWWWEKNPLTSSDWWVHGLSYGIPSCIIFHTHKRPPFLFWATFQKAVTNSGCRCRRAAFSCIESVTSFKLTRRPLLLFWRLLCEAGVTVAHFLSSSVRHYVERILHIEWK